MHRSGNVNVASAPVGEGSVYSGEIKSRMGRKTPLDFPGNLKVRHFASVFDANDMPCQSFDLQTLFEFVLGHFWAKDLDLCGVTNMRDDLVIVFAKMVPETPVTYILR
jgi:hypothetical protein